MVFNEYFSNPPDINSTVYEPTEKKKKKKSMIAFESPAEFQTGHFPISFPLFLVF